MVYLPYSEEKPLKMHKTPHLPGNQYIYIYISGQIMMTSAEVTLNGGLVRESPQNALNSGLGIILICPDQVGCVSSLEGK